MKLMGTIRLSYWPFPSIPTRGGAMGGGGQHTTALHAKNTLKTHCDGQSHAQTEHHVCDSRGRRSKKDFNILRNPVFKTFRTLESEVSDGYVFRLA